MKQLDVLGKLFGSMNRVKLMKFFLLNQDESVSIIDLADRLRVKSKMITGELNELAKIGMIKSRVVVKQSESSRAKKKKKMKGFIAVKDFSLNEPLRNLLIDTSGTHIPDVVSRFAKVGKIGLFIVSGIFIHENDTVMDLLIVGDRLNRKTIEKKIKDLESEIGKELRYAIFDTQEFIYRLNMYDKLLRDVLDYPHQKVISKIDHPELRR